MSQSGILIYGQPTESIPGIWELHPFPDYLGVRFVYRVSVNYGEVTTPKFTFFPGNPEAMINYGDSAATFPVTSGVELSHTYLAAGEFVVTLMMANQELWLQKVDISNDHVNGIMESNKLLKFVVLDEVIYFWYVGYGKVGTFRVTR